MKTQYKDLAGRFPRRGLWAERSGGLLCQMRGQLFDLLSRSIYVGLIYPREIGRYHTLFKVVNFTVQVVFLEKGPGSLGAGFQTLLCRMHYQELGSVDTDLVAKVLAFS